MTKVNNTSHNKARTRSIKRRRRLGFIVGFYMITMIFSYFLGTTNNSVRANSEVKEVYIDSRVVEQGETLWSIAQSYDSDYYATTAEYVEAIKECNNLIGDNIAAGTSLIIPYTK